MKIPGARRLVRLSRAVSTQSEARRLAESGAAHGTLVWALTQSGGRGRMGRRWRSPAGGLWFSWLIRPKLRPAELAQVSLDCGAAIAAALRGLAGVELEVKPPNDVLARDADGRWRKLCGILCEASGGFDRLDWMIIGVGINVNNAPPLGRATALRRLTGRRWPLPTVLRAVMKGLHGLPSLPK